MVSAGSYILGVARPGRCRPLAGLHARTGCAQRLLPAWEGAPARLVEAIVGIALLIWLGELLGTVGLLYAWTLVARPLLLAALAWRALAGGSCRRRGPTAPSGR